MSRQKRLPSPKTLKTLGPVERVRVIVAARPKAERKEVLALCRRFGVNPNTAKTQYQYAKHGRPAAAHR